VYVRGFGKLVCFLEFIACQSAAVCPVASQFDQDFKKRKKVLAKALVAKLTPLQDEFVTAN
jgi:hypothetical protein